MGIPATVTIGGQIWSVVLATSPSEIAAGLSGVASIEPMTGMLFDLGAERAVIDINMSEMLFNLDIAFIHSSGQVVDVKRDVHAGVDTQFNAGDGLGARYFLEVNSGELVSVNVGDMATVDIESILDVGLINDLLLVTAFTVLAVTMMRGIK